MIATRIEERAQSLPAAARRETERRFPLWTLLLALLFLVVASFLYTRLNTFPFTYHPDEPIKVEQVLTGERNFRHPLLLVNASALVAKLTGAHTHQKVVEAGRNCSAVFAAMAVSVFALLAYRLAGAIAMISAAVLLILHPLMFELAHYMKEDTALLAGLAAFFLALELFCSERSGTTALVLGAAAGVAASGKYLGMVAIAAGLGYVLWAGQRRGALVTRYVLGCAAVVLVINWQGWLHPATWSNGMRSELNVLFPQMYKPASLEPFQIFGDLLLTAVWLFAAVHVVFAFWRRQQTSPVMWFLIAAPFLYLGALALLGRETNRYFLPAVAIVILLAAIGIAQVASALSDWQPRRRLLVQSAVAVLLLCVIARDAVPQLQKTYAGFATDHRRELIDFVANSLPTSATLLAESRTGLNSQLQPDEQRVVMGAAFADELGSVAALRERGITHVAVAEANYRKYFGHGWVSSADQQELAMKRREFYDTLFSEGVLRFERKRKEVSVLNPGLRLYQISQ